MRHTLILIVTILVLNITTQAQTTTIPPLNKEITDYVSTVLNKKVDRGECWDLANQALTRTNAKWDHNFTYGLPVDPEKDSIYPGDIMQFYGVKLKYKKGTEYFTETMQQHTAIVYNVISKGVYDIAQQNSGGVRKVKVSDIDLSTIVKGKIKFYRPVK